MLALSPGLFQSTLPVWGATISLKPMTLILLFQSTLPVWGATAAGGRPCRSDWISIHAPRVGSDCQHRGEAAGNGDFNPRSPCGERRPLLPVMRYADCISIHAPRVGSDSFSDWAVFVTSYFNPRSPCGERLPCPHFLLAGFLFQSTLPVWGATAYGMDAATAYQISIHAPRVGSDSRERFSTFFRR